MKKNRSANVPTKHEAPYNHDVVDVTQNLHARNKCLHVRVNAIGVANTEVKIRTCILVNDSLNATDCSNRQHIDKAIARIATKLGRIDANFAAFLAQALTTNNAS